MMSYDQNFKFCYLTDPLWSNMGTTGAIKKGTICVFEEFSVLETFVLQMLQKSRKLIFSAKKNNQEWGMGPAVAQEMTRHFYICRHIRQTPLTTVWSDAKHTHTLSSHTSLSNLAVFTLWVQGC